jgi:hypothetical protein
MARVKRNTGGVPSAARGISGMLALGVGALILASGLTVWMDDLDPIAWASGATSPKDIVISFDDRFPAGPFPGPSSTDSPPRPIVRSLPSGLEIKFQQAKADLAQNLNLQGWRSTLVEEPKPFEEPKASSVAAVPLPRSRPVEANLEPRNDPPKAQAENRTFLEKLSDLLPDVTLASLPPDGGLFGMRPNLASLGYDNVTAVYDISAHAVYMPDGSKLEAHSGFGSLMDDPAHVSEQNVGATPPNVYDLKPREKLFHGVQALRMIPVGDSGTLGRSGLLAHSYMLGPNGDSNGCVSIKNYEKFLKAFTNGEIRRLVVVPRLRDERSASRQST